MGDHRFGSRLNVKNMGVATVALINTFAAIALWQAYHNVMGRAEQRTQSLAQVYADFTFRALDTFDQILVDMQGFVADGFSREQIAGYQRRQRREHPHLLNLFVFDATGAIAIGTQWRMADLSDRDYVVAHREDADIGRFIGRPATSRITPGRWFFPLSRRLGGPEDAFAGVVAANVDLAALSEAFERVREGADTAVSLLHHDGTLMMRTPAVEGVLGRRFAISSLEGGLSRTVQAVSPVDDTRRVITVRQVPHYPLVVLASVPTGAIMAEWLRIAVPVLAAALAMSAAVLGLARHLHRQALSRERLMADLAEAKDQAVHALADLGQAQEAMVRNEKLAALGGLVAGVAHEINTPVGNALTSASFLAQETEGLRRAFADQTLTASAMGAYLDSAGEAVRLILSNCDRAAELIHGFKQVAVDQTSGERRTYDLAEYVDEVLLSLRPKFKHSPHRIVVDIPAGIVVDGYPGALSQVLTNLVVNALTHGFDDGRSGTLRLSARQSGDRVEIVHEDDGRGIPADSRQRVFEPFYTTRRGSGGSGLGLNIVHNIVHRTLAGTLRLESEPERFTRFTITFPLRAPVPAAPAETAPPEGIPA
jgi:Signal transduction histidine kinase